VKDGVDPLAAQPLLGSVPVPDPTKLTTDAVNAATEQWRRDLLEAEHLSAAKREAITARIDAMEKATEIRLKSAEGIPERTALLVGNLEVLHDEKFRSIDLQFRERDIRTDQAATASKQALDAALLAAKELVGQQNSANVEAATKAETNFTKQIDQTSVLISTLEKALTDRISNLDGALTDRILEIKERMDRGEGSKVAAVETRTEFRNDRTDQRAGTSQLLGIIGAIVAVAVLALAVYAAVKP
jgi:hypothetical protein